jgi:putative endonuclease
MEEKIWSVYILYCEGNSLYTGISLDVEKRFLAHRQGKGAKYTKQHPPLAIVYQEACQNHSQALQREYQLKQLTHQEKRSLCQNYLQSLPGRCYSKQQNLLQ